MEEDKTVCRKSVGTLNSVCLILDAAWPLTEERALRMSDDSVPRLSGDQPISKKRHDLLNRGAFADRIAKLIDRLPARTGLVVGIFGPWGSGKTTVLNLLRAKLLESDSVVVSDFNPWRLTDESKIFPSFFSVLSDTIKKQPTSKIGRLWAWAWRCIRRAFGAIIGVVPKLLKWWDSTASEVTDELLKAFGAIAASPDSVALESERNKIVRLLQQFDNRIVVLIDDIDRLDKSETQLLFRVIKACADFPNVSYVLAFDKAVVAEAIGERYGGGGGASGLSFLEKIVQVPIELPAPAMEDLRKLSLDQVQIAVKLTGLRLTDDQAREFVTSLDPVIGTRLTTPRHAKRLRNALMFAVPPLLGEAHPVDLLLIEVVRVFFPEVYSVLCINHSDFSGIEGRGSQHRTGRPRCVDLSESALAEMEQDHAAVAKEILKDLFPRLRSGYGNIVYSQEDLERWSREQRISSQEYCPRYFTQSIPSHDVADAEISAIIAMAGSGDVEGLTTRIASHFSGPQAGRTIEKFRQIETTTDPLTAKTLATAIARNADRLPNPASLYQFAEPPSQAASLISNLLQTIVDRAERIVFVKSLVQVTEPLWFAAECLRWCRVTDEPDKENKNTLTKQERDSAIRVLVRRVKKRAADGYPLFDPDIDQECSPLIAWIHAEGPDPVQAHLVKVFEQDSNQVSRFLRSGVPLAWGEEGPRISDLTENELKNIELLIDLNTLADWVKRCCPGDFDDPQYYFDEGTSIDRQLAEQFMRLYNRRKSNETPT